jgi:hypothetical protein
VNGDFVSPVTAGTSKTLSLGPGQRWTVRVAARDGAGNESEMSPSYTFTTPPVGVPTSPPSWARR